MGDLATDASEGLLFEIFNTVGPVASIRVCRDAVTRRSLGYAYVNFHNVSDAERALDTMNYTLIKNKPCRIMWSQRDPTLRKSGVGNVFVKNLDGSIDHKALYDTFSLFGNILSCKVATDDAGRSQGYGYVHYESEDAAADAIAKINSMTICDKEVYVGHFVRRTERSGQSDWTNLYVKNFPSDWDEAQLKTCFEKFGAITSCKVQQPKPKSEADVAAETAKTAETEAEQSATADKRKLDVELAEQSKQTALDAGDEQAVADAEETLSKLAGEDAEAAEKASAADGSAFGWVNFAEHESAVKAIEALNGATSLPVAPAADAAADAAPEPLELKGPLFVGRAQKKVERERELKAKFEAAKVERIKKYQGVNLFVKNLDDSLADDDLREAFAAFGTITSARVMREPATGASRGFGFVCFSSPEEATKAVAEMNNKLVRGKPVFVALAQRKEVRRAQLEAQHASRRAAGQPHYGLGGQGGNNQGDSQMRGVSQGGLPPGHPMAPPQGFPGSPYGAVPMMYAQPGAQHPMMPPQSLQGQPGQPMGAARGGYVMTRGSPRGAPLGADPRFGGRGGYGVQMGSPQQLGGGQGGPNQGGPGNNNNNQGGNNNAQGGGNRRGRHRGGGGGGAGGGQGGGSGGAQQYKYTQNARNALGPMVPGQAPQQQGGAPMQPGQPMMGVPQGAMQPMMGSAAQQQPSGQQQQMPMQMPQQMPQPPAGAPPAARPPAAATPQAALEPLTTASLASANPTSQKNMIGERLYPLIHQSQPELAGKITGMLLEMDNSELLHLLESPDALRMKVGEALEVLKQHQQQQGGQEG